MIFSLDYLVNLSLVYSAIAPFKSRFVNSAGKEGLKRRKTKARGKVYVG
jgi:hypothetical protein